MIRGTLELQACGVAVTPDSVVLTVRSTEGKTYTVTMPRGMGESLMRELALGLQSLPAAAFGAAGPARTDAAKPASVRRRSDRKGVGTPARGERQHHAGPSSNADVSDG